MFKILQGKLTYKNVSVSFEKKKGNGYLIHLTLVTETGKLFKADVFMVLPINIKVTCSNNIQCAVFFADRVFPLKT